MLLAPAIVKLLRGQWLASPFKTGDDFVFIATTGRGRDYCHVGMPSGPKGRVARPGTDLAAQLRHGYASPLIAKRLDVVFVSRHLGHANANVTLGVYAHLFAQREHAEVTRQALEASYAAMREVGGS